MRRLLTAAALTAVLAGGAAAATPGQAQPLPRATACAGVWVVVDYGSLGGTSTKCAASYGTGTAALKSAGFAPSIADGFVLKIGGKPGKPDINQAYWSYWTATRQDDGAYSGWAYSNVGADDSRPRPGRAEGWRYQSLADGKVAPGVKPPAEVDEPEPEPTPTASQAPDPKPTKQPTKQPTRRPTATPKPTRSARPTLSATAGSTPTATGSAAAGTTPAPTSASPSTADQTPLAAAPAGTTAVAQAPVSAEPAPADTGTPLGAIIAAGLVSCGALGVGGWWLLRGRKG